MDLALFFKGALIGISVAAPVGPICILCVRQAAAYGFWGGIATGFGAAVSDTIYTAGAAFGALVFHAWMQKHAFWFYLFGGLFLLLIAYKINQTKLADIAAAGEKKSLLSTFLSTMVMTFMSPMTTILFISMLSGYGVFEMNLMNGDIVSLALGAGSGAMVWWAIVSYAVAQAYSRKQELSFASLQSPTATLKKAVLQFLWPELKKSQKLNVFLLVNRLAAIGIGVYGLFTLSKLF